MIYQNTTEDAVMALERHRTQNYGNEYLNSTEDEVCDICQRPSDVVFKIRNHNLCKNCVCDSLRELYARIELNMTENEIEAEEILKDIIDDFSDSELLCYVEARYEKI